MYKLCVENLSNFTNLNKSLIQSMVFVWVKLGHLIVKISISNRYMYMYTPIICYRYFKMVNKNWVPGCLKYRERNDICLYYFESNLNHINDIFEFLYYYYFFHLVEEYFGRWGELVKGEFLSFFSIPYLT